jgi:hypothetical protein
MYIFISFNNSVGSVPLFIGNIRLTATWNDAQTFTRDQRDGLLLLQREILGPLSPFFDKIS